MLCMVLNVVNVVLDTVLVLCIVLVVHFHLNQNTCTFLIMQIGNVCPTFSAGLRHLNEMRMHNYAQYHNTTIPQYNYAQYHYQMLHCAYVYICILATRWFCCIISSPDTLAPDICQHHPPPGAAWCSMVSPAGTTGALQ